MLAAHRNKSEESAEHNLTGRPKHQLTERQSVQPKTLGARFHGVNYNMVPLAACIVNPDAGYRGQAIKGASYQRVQAVVGLGCRSNRAFMPFLTRPCHCYSLTLFTAGYLLGRHPPLRASLWGLVGLFGDSLLPECSNHFTSSAFALYPSNDLATSPHRSLSVNPASVRALSVIPSCVADLGACLRTIA